MLFTTKFAMSDKKDDIDAIVAELEGADVDEDKAKKAKKKAEKKERQKAARQHNGDANANANGATDADGGAKDDVGADEDDGKDGGEGGKGKRKRNRNKNKKKEGGGGAEGEASSSGAGGGNNKGAKKQTDPPSIAICDLFPSGQFPEGQIMEYPAAQDGRSAKDRFGTEEKRALDRSQIDMYNEVRQAAEAHR